VFQAKEYARNDKGKPRKLPYRDILKPRVDDIYTEINIRQGVSWKNLSIGLLAGVIVFVLWINMDWKFATMSKPKGFDPFLFHNPLLLYLIISFRLLGASVVVPVFEEIFWRSFVIRYTPKKKQGYCNQYCLYGVKDIAVILSKKSPGEDNRWRGCLRVFLWQ
jgi:hypothetical protein